MRSSVSCLAISCLVLICLLLGTTHAHASPRGASSEEIARLLYDAGEAAYAAGDLEDALQLFEQCHARTGHPQLLYVIGHVADQLDLIDRAIDAFGLYIVQAPTADNREQVQLRVQILEQVRAARHRSSTAVAVEPTVAPVAPSARQVAQATLPIAPATPLHVDEPSLVKQWWFWTAIGAVVVGSVITTIALSGGNSSDAPPDIQINLGTLNAL